jgi:GNAT superfamily N-acetyltransferase
MLIDLRVGIPTVPDDETCPRCAEPLSTAELATRESDGKSSVQCPHCGLKFFLLIEGVSPVQQVTGQARGSVIRTLVDAQSRPDAWLVAEADYGGQILLTMPAAQVRCPEERLRELAEKLAWITWDEPEGAAILFEAHRVGDGRSGGMGGAAIRDGLWVHPELRRKGLSRRIEKILKGEVGMEVLAQAKQGWLLRILKVILKIFSREGERPAPAHGVRAGNGDNKAGAENR